MSQSDAMSDALKAAKRLREFDYRGMGEWRNAAGEVLDAEGIHELESAIADGFLAEHQPDDDEPPTVERLTALLGEPMIVNGDMVEWIGRDPHYEIKMVVGLSPTYFFARKPQINGRVETMGQLRTLLRLAGIEVPHA